MKSIASSRIVAAAAIAAVLALSTTVTSSISLAQTTKKKNATSATRVQTAKVTVNDMGFSPASVPLKAGVPARMIFTRTSKGTCATSVVMPEYKVKRDLPLNKPVTVTFTPKKAGSYTFSCGMNMMKGSVVVR